MSCSIYHEPNLLCPPYFSLWECIKEKDPLSSTRRCPSPTCREGKTRKTWTIFSPERKEDQEDQENSSHLFPRKPIRVRKPGQEIGFLLEVAAPLAALRSIQRTDGIPPSLLSLPGFPAWPCTPQHPDNLEVQGSVLQRDDLLAQENKCHLQTPTSSSRAGWVLQPQAQPVQAWLEPAGAAEGVTEGNWERETA